MNSSQKRDGVWSFQMHANPILSEIVDNNWRSQTLKDICIFVPEQAKIFNNFDNQEVINELHRFNYDNKTKEWNDIGLYDLLSRFTNISDLQRREG